MRKLHGGKIPIFCGALLMLGTSCLFAEEIRFASTTGDKWISKTTNGGDMTIAYREADQLKSDSSPQVLWKDLYIHGHHADCDVLWSADGVHFALTERSLVENEVTIYECKHGKAEKVASLPDETLSRQTKKHVEKLKISGARIESYRLQVTRFENHKVHIQGSSAVDDATRTSSILDFEYVLDLETKRSEVHFSGRLSF